MKTRFFYNILITSATLLMASCGGQKQDNSADAEQEESTEGALTEVTLTHQQMDAVDIKTGPMEVRNLGEAIKVNGQLALDPQSRAGVTSLVAGVVRKILVGEGNSVKAGQVVAYIENTDIVEMQKDYLTALNDLTVANQELERQQLLSSQGAGVKKTLQQAQASRDVARARLSAIAQQLRQLGVGTEGVSKGRLTTLIPIKAPISGIVGRINAVIGSYADMQTTLMTVVDNSRLHCNLLVFEKDVPHLRVGQSVDMVLTNAPTVRLQGRIYEINSAFEDDAKAIKAHVTLPSKPSVRLMPDMFVTALINIGKHDVAAMPSEAIVSKDGKKYIYMEKTADSKGTTFVPVEVATGVSELGYTAVTLTTAVDQKAKFVVRNAFYISSMMEGDTEED